MRSSRNWVSQTEDYLKNVVRVPERPGDQALRLQAEDKKLVEDIK